MTVPAPSQTVSLPARSLNLTEELAQQAAGIAAFQELRWCCDRDLTCVGGQPADILLQRTCTAIRAAARRLPLPPEAAVRACGLVQAMQDAAAVGDADAYSRYFTAATLYLTLPQLGEVRHDLLLPWMPPVVAAATQVGVALVGIGDDAAATEAALCWIMDFARGMVRARDAGKLAGGAGGWPHWAHVLGFDIAAMNFYASRLNLKEFAALFGGLRAAAYAQQQPADHGALQIYGTIPPRAAGDRRWRIALLCSNPHVHAHGLPDFIWWLACLDRSRFEPVLVIHKNSTETAPVDTFIARYKDVLPEYAPLIVVVDSALARLREFDFDFLYNFEGLCWGFNERSAHLRLARRQMTTFYSAATTGGTMLDYYSTSAELDPNYGAAFTEQPVLSSGLPFCFHYASYFSLPPVAAARDPALPQGAVIYTMGSAMLTKLRPEFMDVVLEILRRVPEAVVVAMPLHGPAARVHMTAYMAWRCREAGIAPERIRFHGAATRAELYAMIAASDVFLDFFPFTGTNNIIDPIAHHVPPVVLCPPGGYSRNRIGGVMMRYLGLGELVATTVAEYVDLAVALGNDRTRRAGWRPRLGREMLRDSPLFDGPAFIARMENLIAGIMDGTTAAAPPCDPGIAARLDRDFGAFNSNPGGRS